jgi:hypothetical protein
MKIALYGRNPDTGAPANGFYRVLQPDAQKRLADINQPELQVGLRLFL